MNLSSIRRILREDLARSGDVPKWIDAFITPLNQFLEQVTRAFENRITFADNFQCTIKSVSLTSGVETQVSPESSMKVTGAIVLDGGDKQVTGWGFVRKDNGNLGLTITFSGGGTATCSILILLG